MRVAVAFVLLWIVFDRVAALLGSMRGEAGLAVCALVVGLALLAERVLTGAGLRQGARALGLAPPTTRALVAAVALSAALLAIFPLFSLATGAAITVRPDAAVLAIGILAQGGIAEEALFRGFLFRHVRQGRTFWRAAWVAAVPFVAVHLTLFVSLDFPVALAALLVSLSISFPLAWLFERAGGSVWPCAIVHAVVQGAIKLVEVHPDHFPTLALVWMVASALAPWLFLFLRSDTRAREARG
jgi:membrane protease YdiL (CAAX protease family)